MSSILKALKKLEEEKNVRRPGTVAIDADILKPETSKPRFSPSSMVLLAMLIFGGGSVATYFIMLKILPPQRLSQAVPAKVRPDTSPAPSAPRSDATPPFAILPTETLPAAVIVVPSQTLSRSEQIRTLPKTVVSQPVVRRTEQKTVTAKPSPTPALLSPTLPHLQPVAALPSPPASKAVVPRLRVNGIAFQKGSADNMAIINGTPASNGSAVEGATVEEILKDRVKFSFRGELFEIPLGQSNR